MNCHSESLRNIVEELQLGMSSKFDKILLFVKLKKNYKQDLEKVRDLSKLITAL